MRKFRISFEVTEEEVIDVLQSFDYKITSSLLDGVFDYFKESSDPEIASYFHDTIVFVAVDHGEKLDSADEDVS